MTKRFHKYCRPRDSMQSISIDETSHLQLYSAELPSHFILIQAKSKLTGAFPASTTGLLIFFLLIE